MYKCKRMPSKRRASLASRWQAGTVYGGEYICDIYRANAVWIHILFLLPIEFNAFGCRTFVCNRAILNTAYMVTVTRHKRNGMRLNQTNECLRKRWKFILVFGFGFHEVNEMNKISVCLLQTPVTLKHWWKNCWPNRFLLRKMKARIYWAHSILHYSNIMNILIV